MTATKKPSVKPIKGLEKDLLIVISKGKTPNWFAAAHNVSTREVNYCVEKLTSKGLIERMDIASDEYALTEKGYEKIKRALKDKFKLIEDETPKQLPIQKPEANSPSYIDGDKNQLVKFNSTIKTSNPEPARTESILEKILEEKNRKRQAQQQAKPQMIQKVQQPVKQEEPKKIIEPQNVEKCDLCKGKFSNSVSDPKNRIYGHCFCGASYHEDCYNAIISGNQKCFRCGRKLKQISDKASEAVKDIKDVFE
ncbi:Uncharacterised protein [uncultured archaeon]|nr:Uncharacterised protein [uncultured archaeon]